MPWSVLLPILLEVLKNRADAGFPWLTRFLERFWPKVVIDVESQGVAAVGAAPDEIKTMLVELFTKLRSEAGIVMKAVYTILIQLVPLVADTLWDKLFQAGAVAKPLSDFTAIVVSSSGSDDEFVEGLLSA